MKTTLLAIALAFGTVPLTFAQTPAKTDTSKPAKSSKKHDTSKKPSKKSGGTSNTSATTPSSSSTPVKK